MRLSKAIAVASLTLVLTGCPNGGRWDRHSSGGSFIGARPSESSATKAIVFSSPSTGNGDIYRYSTASASTKQITHNPNYEGDPTYSPDGERIVFIREDEGVGHLWLMNSDGTQQTQLTFADAYDSSPSFSADGKRVVFTRRVADSRFRHGSTLSAETFVIDVEGTGEKRLTNNDVADFEPRFSPDGRYILYDVGAQDIWIMNVDGADAKRIQRGSSASFSPDGKQIVYVSGQFGRELSIMDPDGNNDRTIIKSDRYMSNPIFCTDGTHVIFLEQPTASGTGVIKKLRLSDHSVGTITTTQR